MVSCAFMCLPRIWPSKVKNLLLVYPRWYAKRFLHPDIVARYDYIFIWDEDLGVEHFNAEA
jgi:hypothetical protein